MLPRKNIFTTIHGQWGNYPLKYSDIIQKKIAAKYSSGVMSIGKYLDKNYGYNSKIISYGAANKAKKVSTKDNKMVLYVGRLDENIAIRKVFDVFKLLAGHNLSL